MALIVEGKMPTCCGFCCECLGGGSGAYYCNRAKRQISEVVPPYDKRMEWCPIIGEIPYELENFIIAMSQLPREKPKTATEAKEALAYEELKRRMKKEMQNGADS